MWYNCVLSVMGNGEIVLLIKRYSMGGSRGKSGGPYPPPPAKIMPWIPPPQWQTQITVETPWSAHG